MGLPPRLNSFVNGIDWFLLPRPAPQTTSNLRLSFAPDDLPELAEAFVHERDLYLAWSLKRSKAVNGCKTVVGVVGKGHMRGVCFALTNDASGGLRFRDLAGRQEKKRNPKEAVARFALETGVFVALWLVWEQRGVWSW